MIGYKLTTQDNRTRVDETNETLWGENVTHKALRDDGELCSDKWIHFYTHPLLAVYFNPIHANIANPKLWECEIEGTVKSEFDKSGCKKLTTLREIPLPVITIEQRIEIAIRCSLLVYPAPEYVQWAEDWLSGKDRTSAAASATASAAASAAAYAANAATSATASATAKIEILPIIKSVVN